MKNMKIRHKLQVGLLLVCVLGIMVGLVGILGMGSINSADEDLYKHHLLSLDTLGEIRENLQSQRMILRNYVIFSGDAEKIRKTYEDLKVLEANMDKLFVRYEATINDTSAEGAYFEAKALYQSDFTTVKANAKAAADISFEVSVETMNQPFVATTTGTILENLTLTMNNSRTLASEAVDANGELYRKMVLLTILILVLAVIASLTLSIYLSGLISKPMSRMTKVFTQFGSKGDLRIDEESKKCAMRDSTRKDEIGVCTKSALDLVAHLLETQETLARIADGDLSVKASVLSDQDSIGLSVERVLENLNNMVGEVSGATAEVSIGSKQVSDSAQALAQGSTEQAAAVEQLSSSIAGVAEKTKENADMAAAASQLAAVIKENAEKGSRQMSQMLEAVKDIQEAGKSIGKVIKVIDDIAFQTNILALNAAVEAARAGQHGKGFAVVAEEVRNLAAKSAEAAKDTGSLIANSIEKSALGARIAEETAVSLSDIVTGINKSSKIVGDIAQSSLEQAAAIGQINNGIEQVAFVVQQNSATAQESASVSEEMSEQAGLLENLTSRFSLAASARVSDKKRIGVQKKSVRRATVESKY